MVFSDCKLPFLEVKGRNSERSMPAAINLYFSLELSVFWSDIFDWIPDFVLGGKAFYLIGNIRDHTFESVMP